jgi:hypothetical protein
MDDFEDACSYMGGKVETLLGQNVRVCLYKDVAITEEGEMYPFQESKKRG